MSTYEQLKSFLEEKYGTVGLTDRATGVIDINNLSITFLDDCVCKVIDDQFCIRQEFISPYPNENQWHPIA